MNCRWQVSFSELLEFAFFQLKCNYVKTKHFSQFFVPFPIFTLNFKDFEKKVIVIIQGFPEFKTAEDVVRQTSKKPF